MSQPEIWVLVQHSEGGVTSTSLELLTRARELSSHVSAVSWGGDSRDVARTVGAYGAARLMHVNVTHDNLPGAQVASSLATLCSVHAPAALLAPASYDGRDIVARLSVKIDRPVQANVIGLDDVDGLVTTHPLFGGTQNVRVRLDPDGVALVLVRPKSFVAESGDGPAAELIACDPPAVGFEDARVLSRHVEDRSGPQLEDARVVVSGGRGIGNAEGFASIEELARLLGGAAGASRAVVDAGWVPYSRQVGQTGKTVKPDVYVACGISGATQHVVGMKASRNIIAINRDPEAPIFQHADLGVVGDLSVILPRLLRALTTRR